MRFSVALVFLIFVSIGQASAADVRHGETLAQRWCRTCHIISAEQTRSSAQAAPFSEIAKARDFDAARLALFLLAPHPRMPDMNLTRAEAADLAAYIAEQGR